MRLEEKQLLPSFHMKKSKKPNPSQEDREKKNQSKKSHRDEIDVYKQAQNLQLSILKELSLPEPAPNKRTVFQKQISKASGFNSGSNVSLNISKQESKMGKVLKSQNSKDIESQGSCEEDPEVLAYLNQSQQGLKGYKKLKHSLMQKNADFEGKLHNIEHEFIDNVAKIGSKAIFEQYIYNDLKKKQIMNTGFSGEDHPPKSSFANSSEISPKMDQGQPN